MHLHLVDRHRPGTAYDGEPPVALSAAACADLERDGIAYRVPEDLHPWPEGGRDDRAHFDALVQWFDGLDRTLAERAGGADPLPVRPFRIYGYHLHLLLDSAALQGRLWSAILQALRPRRVTYHTEAARAFHPNWRLILTGDHPHRYLIPGLCREGGIPCEVRLVEADTRTSSFQRNHPFRHLAARILEKVPFGRHTWGALRNGRQSAGPRSRAEHPHTFLLLARGWGLDECAQGAWRQGHRVLFTDGVTLDEFEGPAMRPLSRLDDRDAGGIAGLPPTWGEACREILSSRLYAGWIAEQGGVELAEYLLPRMRYFLEAICPDLIAAARTFARLLARERVDYVLTHSQAHPWQCAAMNVATAAPGVVAVQITHGYDPLVYPRELTELPCNLYVTLDREYAAYFRTALNARSGWDPVTVTHHPAWLQRYGTGQTGGGPPPGRPARPRARPRIVYVPTLFAGDVRRIGEPTYPPTWYYRFQLELARHFAARPDYEFVWKAPEAEMVYNPMRERIAALGASNIRFRNGRLLDEYRRADRVITDPPSTPMIEALAMGLPTLVLAHDSFTVRPGAQEKFGKIVQPFATAGEAIQAIDRFLQDDPESYRVPVVEPAGGGIVELLIRSRSDGGVRARVGA